MSKQPEFMPAPKACPPQTVMIDGEVNVDVPMVIIPPCQPCLAVDGVVDEDAFVVLIDGVASYYNLDGPLEGDVEVLDPCDPRCLCTACDGDGGTDDLPCCECNPEDQPDLAAAFGSIFSNSSGVKK